MLRRAPDNLAAIRGLAELHDRFEHTLNLPMDGPGQWPPSAADVEDLADAPTVANAVSEFHVAPADSVATDVVADESPAVMVPADMGMPIWSPVVAAPADVSVAQAPPVAHAESVTTPTPAASPVSSRSSVREIDFQAAASTEALQQASAPAEVVVDLAALIAEAESLEAAAEAAVVMTTAEVEAGLDHAATVELLADLDLSADQDLAAQLQLTEDLDSVTCSVAESDLPVTIELRASDDASDLDVLAVVTASGPLDSGGGELAESEVVLEASALADSDALLAMPEATATALAEPEVVSEAMPEVMAEPGVVLEASTPVEPEAGLEASAQVEPELMAEVASEAVVEPEVVPEASAPAEPEVVFEEPALGEPVAAQDQEEIGAPEFANVLAFAPAADAAVSSGTVARDAGIPRYPRSSACCDRCMRVDSN